MKDKFHYEYVAIKSDKLYEIMALNKNERMVLAWFINHLAPYRKEIDGHFVMTLMIGQKKAVIKDLGYDNVSSINTALSGLVKHNILRRLDHSRYQLNPDVFGNIVDFTDWSIIK